MSDAPMSDDDLPRFEPRRASAFLRPSSLSRSSSRKRSFGAAIPSDPPVFSSDDNPDIGLEDYDSAQRVKKKSRGPWWRQSSQPMNDAYGRGLWNMQTVRAKRSLSRKIDSAVWMDGSSDPIDPDHDGEERPRPEPVQYTAPETLARELVNKAVQNHNETFDLERMGLTELHSSTFKPLETLIRHPKIANTAFSPAGYEPIAPKIKLFLGNNALRSLPMGMLNLQYLTVLSLRNNQLEELPTSICQLYNLEELNVSCNKLKWLPFELLRLFHSDDAPVPWEEPALKPFGKLRVFHCSLNPFLKLDCYSDEGDNGALTADQKSVLARSLAQTIYFGSDEVTGQPSNHVPFHLPSFIGSSRPFYVDIRHSLDSTATEEPPQRPVPLLTEEWEDDSEPVASKDPSTQPATQGSAVPSLRELCLRRVSRELLSFDQFYTDFPPHTPSEVWTTLGCGDIDIPSSFTSGLKAAAEQAVRIATRPENAFEVPTAAEAYAKQLKLDGRPLVVNHHCATCGNFFVQPLYEWFEFFILGDLGAYIMNPSNHGKGLPNLVPFRRTACSQACARPTRIGAEFWNEKKKKEAVEELAVLSSW